jgi:hypothetical protein
MKSDRKKVASLLAFVGLMMVGGVLEAGHEVTSNPDVTEELLASHTVNKFNKAACTVNPAKELFITDVSVVDDCYRTTWNGTCPGTQHSSAARGAWTFGRLMEGVFGTSDPEELSGRVSDWLNLWTEDHTVNGDLVASRPLMRDLVLRPWEKASHGEHLDMKKAPFRLLAIVDQQFISQSLADAGQLRFIYNLLDANGNPTDFNVIFEFQMPGSSCQETLALTNAFHTLSALPFGPTFNATLQSITDRVVTRNAWPGRLNGSALMSLRTNEAFLGSPWEMRSFSIQAETGCGDDDQGHGDKATRKDHDNCEDGHHSDKAGRKDHDGENNNNGRLAHSPLDLTPAAHYQGTQVLADFITEFAPTILSADAQRVLPLTYRGEPFLGGVAHNALDLGWGGPAPVCATAPKAARRTFSFRTCQGCHGLDTATPFVHVHGRQAGQPSQLSKFLTGPTYVVRDACTALTSNELFIRQFHQCFLLAQVCPSPPAAPKPARKR